VVDITEILVHWQAGRSISEVAHSLGVDRNTVRKYIAPAVAAGIVPGGEPISLERWGELIGEWFPQLHTTELRHPRFGEIAPFHELIREQLAVNTVNTIWQRLRDERGLQASIASFRRYI
jgi:predicted transcriptional regulator